MPDASRHRDGIPPSRFATRLASARALAADRGLGALMIGLGADMAHLTGYEALALERLSMLVVPSTPAKASLVVPLLEAPGARACPAALAGLVEVATWEETDDPYAIVAGLVTDGSAGGAAAPAAVGIGDHLWTSHLLRIAAELPATRLDLASLVTTELRIRKDADEIRLLGTAAAAADRVVEQIAATRLIGRTEADIAAEVRDRLVAAGHDRAEFAIVASGPNSASPHHAASGRRVAAGDPIVLDIGGVLEGYGSDITRTLWVTGGDPAMGPDKGFRRLFSVLRAAQAEAVHAVRPNVPCQRIDDVAREIIAAEGYGASFIHRTGHGIGLETHEEPYIVAGNVRPLEPGMVFSVEPGIYLDGRCGARLEDIVVCGEDGPIVLNQAPLDLLVVDGR